MSSFQTLAVLLGLSQAGLSLDYLTCRNIASLNNYYLLPGKLSCGKVLATSRVMGGKNAYLGQFPWVSVLMTESKDGVKTMFCVGSVINNKYILTAAHCMNWGRLNRDTFIVRLGEHDMSTDPDCQESICAPPVQEFRVDKVITHDKYDPSVRREYDITLLRLNASIVFHEFVQPICLPTTCSSMHSKLVGAMLKTCGWGNNLDIPKLKYTKILQKVGLQVIPFETCKKNWPDQRLSAELRMCAGGSEVGELGKDSCEGDSGGPLMFLNDREGFPIHYVIVGIVSEGPECKRAHEFQAPGIVTRVGAFVQWILNNIQE